MSGFVSKLISNLFKRASARSHATWRCPAGGFEPLETRAVLSTVGPFTAADDVVDGRVITGENSGSAHVGGGGGGAGKVAMQDFHFSRPAASGKVSMNDFHFVMRNNSATSPQPGGANFAFGDGSVRFLKDSIDIPPTWNEAASTGAGGGKVSMNDFHFVMRTAIANTRSSDAIHLHHAHTDQNIWTNQSFDNVIDGLARDVAQHYSAGHA